MRKQTKLVAVLSAAALLAIGATMTASAATAGWTDQDGVWVYLDSNGERVENEWKKSNNSFYYLDENGEMTVDAWIDDEYYVGSDGKMITNNWALLAVEDNGDDPDADGEKWFYFDSKGQKITTASKTINGKVYFFNEDGQMRDNWYHDEEKNIYYYLGEDGARKTGWLWLEPSDNEDIHDEDCDECENEGWYWFDTSGKMHRSGGEKKINGKYYYFNTHGQMIYNWVNVSAGTASNAADGKEGNEKTSIDKMRYALNIDKGERVTGWLKVDGSEDVETIDDNSWYYFNKGKAKYATQDVGGLIGLTDKGSTRYRVKERIEGKYFCFNENGGMETGLQAIALENGEYATYYFDESGMKTGKVSDVELDSGDMATFYFSTTNAKKGQGVTGEKDNYLYFKGMRVEASDDYKLVSVTGEGDITKEYLVNTSGKIQTSKAGKKISGGKIENNSGENDLYLYTNTDGSVLKFTRKTDGMETEVENLTVDDIDDEILAWE